MGNNKKNYIILIILLVATFSFTLLFSKIYLNKSKEYSIFYMESNKITSKELEQVSLEEPDVIYYISDKYDLNNFDFEIKLKAKLEEKNLLNKLVYIDTKKSLIKKFKGTYKLDINIDKYPIIVFVVDKKVIKTIYVKDNENIDNYIDYGVYE